MSHLVGEKGQVVIAKEIRERLGIERGWSTVQRLVGDHVELYFVPPAHRRSLKGSLYPHIQSRPVDAADWSAIRESAWGVSPATTEAGSDS